MFLSKDDILGCNDIAYKDVSAFGGTVRIKTMTGAERDSWEDSLVDEDGKPKKDNKTTFRASLLVRCIVDEKGNRVFGDKDAEALSRKSAKSLGKLYEEARKLNGIGKDVEEEIEKNSEGVPGEGSISA